LTGTKRSDVVIVGGGPAGAATAWALARNGVDVLVLERGRSAGTGREAVGDEAWDILREIGVLPAIMATSDAARPRAVHRDALDRALLDACRGAGARVAHGTPATAVTPATNGAQVAMAGPAGPTTVDARLVVGADGAESVVAVSLRAAGGRRRALCGPRVVLVGDAAAAVEPFPGDRLYAALHGGITLGGYIFETLCLPPDRAHEPLEAYARWRRHVFGMTTAATGPFARIASAFLTPDPAR
jgi:2-polyprenyl-6-methoxyphenol hydroxylase-like FAD-dependent oxidoreductase